MDVIPDDATDTSPSSGFSGTPCKVPESLPRERADTFPFGGCPGMCPVSGVSRQLWPECAAAAASSGGVGVASGFLDFITCRVTAPSRRKRSIIGTSLGAFYCPSPTLNAFDPKSRIPWKSALVT
eukprot:TRINITY_DN22264_c0_g1_i3.p1 TRINITY_DN22264_c0_g1~~TRINITY_DN22264_c0_g1_i3.p1  ORF type:complete len:125 (-),score=11.83 TRINITY_DN22264_c0_g1_i3:54-428(-)